MKTLIGTPTHISKDYCAERWFENVAKVQKEHPADLFLADNSPGPDYAKKLKGYCGKYGIENYKIKYLELTPEQGFFERVARSREAIRQEILAHDYDAWFSWECDQIVPANTLDELERMMKIGDFMMVNHNNWTRQIPDLFNADFGVALIKRECLEKHGFILEFGTDPEMPKTWEPGEAWFRKRVLRDGGNYIEVQGVIGPIYHLNE